jgi:hypothetical protein
MAFWLIGGGIAIGAWAMLSVVGSELARRTYAMENRVSAATRREQAQNRRNIENLPSISK